MEKHQRSGAASHRPVRIAVVAAAMAVAACFGAAFTFVGEGPAQAGDGALNDRAAEAAR